MMHCVHVGAYNLLTYVTSFVMLSIICLPYKKTVSPTRTKLFPYTTLFRSPDISCLWHNVIGAGVVFSVGTMLSLLNPGEGDRKSTRLNSSHLVISYAVFCLKEKNLIRLMDKVEIKGFCLVAKFVTINESCM